VRYSGSPLAFSFSEKNHTKSVSLVEVAADGSVSVQSLATPVPRPLREVRGRLADLLALSDPDLPGAWVKAVLTDASRPAAPMERLRERWPHTLVLDFAPEGPVLDSAADLRRTAETSDPIEMCSSFMQWVDSTLPDGRHLDTLRSVVEAVRRVEASA